MQVKRSSRREGIVLPLVLIIGLLLSAAVFTFVRRSLIDAMIVRNRNAAGRAEALARGGLRIGIGIAFHERFSKAMQFLSTGSRPGDSLEDLWARVGATTLTDESGGTLRIRIEDGGARLNLNALVPVGKVGAEARPSEEAEELLTAVLQKVLDELEQKTKLRLYDAREMARNLLDYMDADDVAIDGRDENDYYLGLDPPRKAPNRPLLSADEVALVEGFDVQIAEALGPYVTTYPLLGGSGIDLNTAPPHVLALVFHGGSGDMRLANEETVRRILQARQKGALLCEDAAQSEKCVTLSEVGLGEGGIYPQSALPASATTFRVRAEARVGDVMRRGEAIVDLTDIEQPALLSWKLY